MVPFVCTVQISCLEILEPSLQQTGAQNNNKNKTTIRNSWSDKRYVFLFFEYHIVNKYYISFQPTLRAYVANQAA